MTKSRTVTAVLGALALVAAGAGVASASTTASATTGAAATPRADERCEAALPAVVIGDPGVKAGAADGVRVWHDGTGWHLRATHPGTAPVVFTGTVRSPREIKAEGYLLEKQDGFTLSQDKHLLTFRFVNHGGVDGIDFTDNCAIRTAFSFTSDGSKLPTAQIDLGRLGGHPATDPFVIDRHRL